MTPRPATILHLLHLSLLRCASLLVPARQRGEWWKEWRAELWHVRQARTPAQGILWTAEQEVTMFCLGAFQDALCLRGQVGRGPIPHATTMGSAAQCIFLLAAVAAASYGIALLLPRATLARHAVHYRDAQRLMLIHDNRWAEDAIPTISAEQYRFWKSRQQDIFDGFAFYRVTQLPGPGVRDNGPTGIALASSNLFDVLGVPIRFVAADSKMPRLILSDSMWKREFGGDPNVSGTLVRLGAQVAVVGGVAPEGAWRLPGNVDGWLLLPDAANTADGNGFLVAHLRKSAEHDVWGDHWQMSARDPDGSIGSFSCSSLTESARGPMDLFLFAVFLACLALPATTSLPLGEYRVTSQKLSWPTRLNRWGFLVCKIALLLPIVYFASLDLAYLRVATDRLSSEYIQLVSSFAIGLFGLRWVLRDQRQRCPVCLRRLTHPAHVGEASRSFLAWNGTELICAGGHGLLHIPEIQTSWFSTQRWLYLDPSWDVLFADPGLAAANYF